MSFFLPPLCLCGTTPSLSFCFAGGKILMVIDIHRWQKSILYGVFMVFIGGTLIYHTLIFLRNSKSCKIVPFNYMSIGKIKLWHLIALSLNMCELWSYHFICIYILFYLLLGFSIFVIKHVTPSRFYLSIIHPYNFSSASFIYFFYHIYIKNLRLKNKKLNCFLSFMSINIHIY